MDVRVATDQAAWDAFLLTQKFTPFLQSWTMGEVYRDIGQDPIRLIATRGDEIAGIAMGHLVPARRGRHLSVPYGPLVAADDAIGPLLNALREAAHDHDCSFFRISPFWPADSSSATTLQRGTPSPLHLLAEHLWYLPLAHPDPWLSSDPTQPRTEQELLSGMRATARNLIRRAEKEGVTITRSEHPTKDLSAFLALHDETRHRHGFTPYSTAFFRSQVEHFAPQKELSLYLAHYKGEVIASSIHMHMGRETSYHHGASTIRFRHIPASYLLQWTTIRDALRRGDRVYNFWGVSPEGAVKHPFAGVRTFKTAFGGTLLELAHCTDFPLSKRYLLTRAVEQYRKWRRGF